MENSTETVCRLCVNAISGENLKIVEENILRAVLIVSTEEDVKPVVCAACSLRLFEAYQFKTICMETENNISSHVDSENISPVDLQEIYLKVIGKEHLGTMKENERICRLCMHIVTSGFVSVNDVKIDMILTCIPEINFSSTKEPVICAACLDSLNTYNSFLKSCFEKKGQIKSFCNNEETPCGIKVEDIEIKSEENEEHSDGHKINLAENMPDHTVNLKTNQFKHENSSEVPVFKCYICNFTFKHRSSLVSHRLRHENISEVKLHECDACGFKTRYKRSLSSHRLIHKDSAEIDMYRCGICDFKTKYKHCLKNHKLRHKDLSEMQLYKCGKCDYKCKQKGSLVCHQLQHKNNSKVRLYECNTCDFKTKQMSSLIEHQLKHESSSEVQMDDCGTCDHKTKYKYYQCTVATRDYKTCNSSEHKDSSEVQVYN